MKNKEFVKWLIFLIGFTTSYVFFMIDEVSEYLNTRKRDICVKGVVVKKEIGSVSRNTIYYKVGFLALDKVYYEFEPQFGFRKEYDFYDVGDSLLVYYNYTEPEKAVAPSIVGEKFHGLNLIFPIGGLIAILSGIIHLISIKKNEIP